MEYSNGETEECDSTKCNFCDTQLSTDDFYKHEITGETWFNCKVCTLSESLPQSNTKSSLTLNPSVKCLECNEKFPTAVALKQHAIIHVKNPSNKVDLAEALYLAQCKQKKNRFKCEECSKDFKLKDQLINHTRIHSGEKPYKCNICLAPFRHYTGLKSHMLVHSEARPYKCQVCSFAFKQKIALTNHLKVHSGEKPYKCHICFAPFARKDKLKQHMRVHKG